MAFEKIMVVGFSNFKILISIGGVAVYCNADLIFGTKIMKDFEGARCFSARILSIAATLLAAQLKPQTVSVGIKAIWPSRMALAAKATALFNSILNRNFAPR